MRHSVAEMRRPVRRRLKRVVHRSRDKDHARRALALRSSFGRPETT